MQPHWSQSPKSSSAPNGSFAGYRREGFSSLAGAAVEPQSSVDLPRFATYIIHPFLFPSIVHDALRLSLINSLSPAKLSSSLTRSQHQSTLSDHYYTSTCPYSPTLPSTASSSASSSLLDCWPALPSLSSFPTRSTKLTLALAGSAMRGRVATLMRVTSR